MELRENKQQSLSCEQVYNIWASEPYLIKIIDLRDKLDFEKAHIPGAEHLELENFKNKIISLNDQLAVIIALDSQKEQIEASLKDFSNYVLMKNCMQWLETGKPVNGSDVQFSQFINFNLKGNAMNNEILFHQLFEVESSTYTYIIADKASKEAAIIDPVLETVDRDLKLIEELGLKLLYVLDTHIHADHITGANEIRKRTQAKTAVSQEAGVSCADIALENGQELFLGKKIIKVISTPGHTNTCLTFNFENMLFTGDALLIRGCGRTDFQQGSSDKLYESVHEKIFRFPDDTIIYPGHDYRGQTSSTVGLEKQFNPRLGIAKTKEQFKSIMSELKLANPKKIREAVPANLACGQPKIERAFVPQIVDGTPEISCEETARVLKKVKIIDVRRPDEFNNELAHIENAQLITLGPELTTFLENGNRNDEIVFVCRSGARSGNATLESIKLGYKFTANMVGGMIRWNEVKLPVEKK